MSLNPDATAALSDPVLSSPPKRDPTLTASQTSARSRQRKVAADERKRAVRACEHCRRLKEKCDGNTPCARCCRFRRVCEYKSTTAVRQESRTQSAVQGDLHERCRHMERILRYNFKDIALDIDSLRRMAKDIKDQEGESSSHLSPLAEDISLEDEVFTIEPVEHTTTHYSGEHSYWNFSMRLKRFVDGRIQGSPGNETQEDDSEVSGFWRAEKLRSSRDHVLKAISSCPPRPVAEFLEKTFTKYAITNFFYVDLNWLHNELHRLYEDPNSFGSKDASTISILLTVFAIGTQYAYLESSQNAVESPTAEDEIGTVFYQQAIRLLPEVIEMSSLESVQACLLLGLYALPIDASGLGYTYLGLAVRLGIQNGMHRKYTGKMLSPIMIEIRNRVWWTAYSLERRICIFHGRPLSILRSDVDTEFPKELSDILTEDSRNSYVAHMNASLQLTHNLENYFHEISLLRRCKKNETSKILSRLIADKHALMKWWETIPDKDLVVHDKNAQARNRSLMHLKLEHCLIRMFVGRPLIFSHRSPQSNGNSPHAESPTRPTFHDDANAISAKRIKKMSCREELVYDCVEAGKEALAILRSSHDGQTGLARASYTEYSSCRASLLVLIANSVQTQSDEHHVQLRDGLELIRKMSATGDSARSEVSLIETLERALGRLHVFQGETLNTDAPDPEETISGYERFKQWQSMWNMSDQEAAAVSSVNATTLPSTAQQAPLQTPNTTYDWLEQTFGNSRSDSFFLMPGIQSQPFYATEPFEWSAQLLPAEDEIGPLMWTTPPGGESQSQHGSTDASFGFPDGEADVLASQARQARGSDAYTYPYHGP